MKKYIYILALCFLSLSCKNDLGKDLYLRPKALLINAQIDQSSDINYVFAVLSDTKRLYPLNKAQLNVFVDGKKVAEGKEISYNKMMKERPVRANDDFNYYSATSDIHILKFKYKFQPKQKVQIEVIGNNGEYKAHSKDVVVPDSVKIVSASFTPKEGKYLCKVKFSDIQNQRNYYKFDAMLRSDVLSYNNNDKLVDSSAFYTLHLPDCSQDPLISPVKQKKGDDEDLSLDLMKNTYNTFSDETFKNGECEVSGTIDSYSADIYSPHSFNYYDQSVKNYVIIRVASCSEDEYNYLKGVSIISQDILDSKFFEPIVLPNNVIGGNGFVSIFTPSTYTIYYKSDENNLYE